MNVRACQAGISSGAYTALVALVLPIIAFGATVPPTNFKEFVGVLIEIMGVLVVFVFALTFLVFIWGIARAWIFNGGDKDEIEKGKKIVLTGVIVLVVMSGIWGILELLRVSLFG